MTPRTRVPSGSRQVALRYECPDPGVGAGARGATGTAGAAVSSGWRILLTRMTSCPSRTPSVLAVSTRSFAPDRSFATADSTAVKEPLVTGLLVTVGSTVVR